LISAVDRISHYIEAEGVLNLTQTKKAWAAELGVTHEALYRSLRRTQVDDRLSVEGNQLTSNPIPHRLRFSNTANAA